MRHASCVVVLLFLLGSAFAETVGDINSDENNLSWMISVSRSWDGTNPDLNGQLTDTLPCDVRATVTFKSGTFSGGTYRGWLHKGDFVFYQVEEVVPCTGERRRIIRAGRCGNPATGRYFVPKPKPEPQPEPPPCEPTPCKPPPRPQPPPIVCPVSPQPPPIVNVTVEAPECPTPPTPVVNNYIACPEPERPLPRQPHAGAQKVRYRQGTAIYLVAGYVSRDTCRQPPTKKCTDFPDPNRPINPPPAPADPAK